MRSAASASALLLLIASAPDPRGGGLTVPAVSWRASAPGVERADIEVSGGGEGWRTRVVAVRLDPARVRFRLRARLENLRPAWGVERAPADAIVAINAGQFSDYIPWGWVVMGGREIRPPGRGPLSTAIAWDTSGHVHWMDPAELEVVRRRADIAEALQSYPTLLDTHGQLPREIRQPGLGVDVEHRDRRLAIGATEDGRLLIAITRFYGLGELSPNVPLGLSLEEMATVMRGLGCRRAVSLDGGISAQLLVREQGRTMMLSGWRSVPLGLVAEPMPRAD